MDKKLQDGIKGAITPIIESAVMAAAVSAVTAIIADLVVTNYKKHDLTGDTELLPTKDKATMSESEVAASETEGKLAQDTVAGT
ncbi:MAG: hypothetical protein LBU17_00590, partial [Treponema sp.]|nr:hypothetical protein [Treponema sp.]